MIMQDSLHVDLFFQKDFVLATWAITTGAVGQVEQVDTFLNVGKFYSRVI